MPSKTGLRKRRGFTLVELLVVIAIISVLTAVGFPMAKKMRSRTADNQCVEQLHAWSNVISMYSAEHGGAIECRNWNSIGSSAPSAYVTYFSGDENHASGYRTLGKMRCCPALTGKDAKSGNGNSLTSYSMTDPSGSSDGKKVAAYNLAQIQNPSRFVIMIETIGGSPFIRTAAEYNSQVRPLTVAGKMRHAKGGVNTLFGDFSVRTMTWQDIEKSATAWTTF